MNFATQVLHTKPTCIKPFQPQNHRERIVATVVRMMLRYELLRIQLESKLTDADEHQRRKMKDEAIRHWLAAFHLQQAAAEAGMQFSYDDQLIRREAIRTAYLLVRNAVNQARLIEEATVTISVNEALYGLDEEVTGIAEAA